MNIRKTFISTIGALAVAASSIVGASVMAQESADVPVNYGCASTAGSVAVAVNGEIDYGLGDFSGDGAQVVVTLDLTCNFSANFNVSAKIDTFTLQGPGSGNPLMQTAFGGEHFRMDNGAVTSIDFPVIDGFTQAPEVQETVFDGWVTEEDAIVEDNDVFAPLPWVPILGLFQASPGVSVIEWDASVVFLPLNLTPGTYTAPLTVDLTVN